MCVCREFLLSRNIRMMSIIIITTFMYALTLEHLSHVHVKIHSRHGLGSLQNEPNLSDKISDTSFVDLGVLVVLHQTIIYHKANPLLIWFPTFSICPKVTQWRAKGYLNIFLVFETDANQLHLCLYNRKTKQYQSKFIIIQTRTHIMNVMEPMSSLICFSMKVNIRNL